MINVQKIASAYIITVLLMYCITTIAYKSHCETIKE